MTELREEFEAVHLGHHEIQDDHVRTRLRHPVEGDAAVRRLCDRPSVAREMLPHRRAHVLIVVDQKKPAGTIAQATRLNFVRGGRP